MLLRALSVTKIPSPLLFLRSGVPRAVVSSPSTTHKSGLLPHSVEELEVQGS